jgi:hypothetical protein
LQEVARAVEARIGGDAHGVGICADEKPPLAEIEAQPQSGGLR